MACRGFWSCLLKLLNFILTLAGLAMIGYGIYLFVIWEQSSSSVLTSSGVLPGTGNSEVIQLGRPLMLTVSSLKSITLPTAWFIYLFIGVGAILFVISLCGCIGIVCKNRCCISCYAVLVLLLILIEVGCAAFIFFDSSWQDVVPTDSTGDFDMIYEFLEDNWSIAKWVAVGIVVLEVLTFLLAIIVRAANRQLEYDSDEEFINPRIRQPLISRQAGPPATGVPIVPVPEQRNVRSDAWSTRMREKYGLDTNEFSYDPNDPNRHRLPSAPPAEERGGCSIL